MEAWKTRVETEKEDLLDKMDKLHAFLHSPKFLELTQRHQDLLNMQFKIMQCYNDILMMRLDD